MIFQILCFLFLLRFTINLYLSIYYNLAERNKERMSNELPSFLDLKVPFTCSLVLKHPLILVPESAQEEDEPNTDEDVVQKAQTRQYPVREEIDGRDDIDEP